ncbi:hypothetical protein NA57DRAFT_58678 [Rhizodiscina lignyota]|uniref:DUF7514 domain-containing protein n=1 Tax=Rhizodiscina lignyota TaxID=1504668 RepID=A0A9P4M3J7_9PEZI|nr:hypothetical protein NA57DRAFT_58678 [Rhizodiscina lignyota]
MSYDPYSNPPPPPPPPPQQQQQPYPPYPPSEQHPNLYPPYMPYDVSQYAPDPRSQSLPYPPEGPDGRPRVPPPTYHHPSQPHIFEAVNQAFDKSEPMPPSHNGTSQISPDLIQQITQQITESVRTQVLNELQASATVPPQSHGPPHQPSMPIPVPQQANLNSPLTSTSSMPVYTPPSPTRHDEDESDDNDTIPPSEPRRHHKEDLSGRYGDRSVPMEERSRSRPPIERTRTSEEETTLEKIWQPLFDSENRPTNRLSQFLCGLALHLIEDYEPKKSLVIPPAKMLRFYDEVALDREPYPWRDLFTKLKYDTLSRIYRSLGCTHHFIQDAPNSQPSVPALTPEGFCQWLTLLIQAHPETEFNRLAMAVRDMPISNADDPRERFPKELSRRLFPKHHNSEIRHRCSAALLPPPPPGGPPRMNSESVPPPRVAESMPPRVSESVPPRMPDMTRIPDMPLPPPQATPGARETRTSPPPASVGSAPTPGAFTERERAPYSASVPGGTSTAPTEGLPFRNDSTATDASVGAVPASVVSDSAAYAGTSPLERVTSLPIERERKPYIAREGQGKIYESGRGNGSDATLKPTSIPDSIKKETDAARRRRSSSQSYSMPPPPTNTTRTHHPSLSASSLSGTPTPNVPPTSATASAAATTGLSRSDTTKRARSPTGSVGSNGYGSAPPAAATYGTGSQVYSGSEDEEYAARKREERRERERERDRDHDDDDRRERRKDREREERREREKEREREERREREREYERRERDKYREPDRDRDSDRSDRREKTKEYDKDYERRERERVDRDRDRVREPSAYRLQADERDRYDDDVSTYSTRSEPPHSHHRRTTTGGTNGYGPPPTGSSTTRGGY